VEIDALNNTINVADGQWHFQEFLQVSGQFLALEVSKNIKMMNSLKSSGKVPDTK
jgi:hypothetical protein